MSTIDRVMAGTDKVLSPYYQQQYDRATKAREARRTELIAELMEAEGCDEVEALVRELESLAQPILMM